MRDLETSAPECREIEVVVSCSAQPGKGGLGRHLSQVLEERRQQGQRVRYFSIGVDSGDTSGRSIEPGPLSVLGRAPGIRNNPGLLSLLSNAEFDRAVAAQLPSASELVAFSGQALRSFGAARKAGYRELTLESATAHARLLEARFAEASRRFPLEASWLSPTQIRRTLGEYAAANTIVVASRYSEESFTAQGIPQHRLRRRELSPAPRFWGARRAERVDETFRIIYVGSLTVTKGVPLLLEAFSRLSVRDAELRLVGGWTSRGMRVYLQRWQAQDPRIRIASGDPLPHLQRADVYVHPSYSDGFGLAPMEALACGVPVVVTEDTGMKEHVRDGLNGYVVPTGHWEPILERLEHLAARPLFPRAAAAMKL